MFANTQNQEYGTPFQNLMLFLTDGNVTGRDKNETELLAHIQALDTNNSVNATIFTYGLGSEANMTVLKNISYQHHGVAKKIEDNKAEKLKTEMIGYYSFLATGISIDNILWAEPWSDWTLRYLMTKAVLPVYVPRGVNSNSKVLLGLLVKNVFMQSFETYVVFLL